MTDIFSIHPYLAWAWITIGFLTGIWMLLDFISNGYSKDHYNKWDYLNLTLFAIFFFVLDIVIWPIYVLEKIMEAMWHFRQRR